MAAGDAGKLGVFISYSRDDLAFADQLDAALGLHFATTIDRHGISGGEDWKRRLGNLIRAADTVVFVLSPASATSDICRWEVDEAVRLGKRILPVLCKPLDGVGPPQQLQNLNYIFFYGEPKSPGSGFGAGLVRLVEALNSDLDWLREHTRLLQRATEWDVGGRPSNRLLSGEDIGLAKAWAARRPKEAPTPTALHLDLKASEDWDTRQQSAERQRLAQMAEANAERAKALEAAEVALKREAEASRRVVRITFAGLAAALVLALIASGAGYYASRQRGEALAQKAEAETQKVEAEKQALVAQEQTKVAHAKSEEAERNFREGQRTETYFRAQQAAGVGGDAVTSALLALEGVPDENSDDERQHKRPFVNEIWYALHSGWERQRERAVIGGHTDAVNRAVFSPDGGRILTVSSDGTARLWDRDGKPLATLQSHTGSTINRAVFSPDGGRILTASSDRTPRLWEAFPMFQDLVEHVKADVPRCLTTQQRVKFILPPDPPSWCRAMNKWPYDAATVAAQATNAAVAAPR